MSARAERVRWKIARLADRLPGMCWADLVTWVVWREPKSLSGCRVSHACQGDREANGICYCGKLRENR